MKTLLLVFSLILVACSPVSRDPINYKFDEQKHAKEMGWAGVKVKGPGIAYDEDGKAYVVK